MSRPLPPSGAPAQHQETPVGAVAPGFCAYALNAKRERRHKM